MTRVQTSYKNGSMIFKQNDGLAVAFDSDFDYNNHSYHFLGGFYYDLEPNLIDHIFGENND